MPQRVRRRLLAPAASLRARSKARLRQLSYVVFVQSSPQARGTRARRRAAARAQLPGQQVLAQRREQPHGAVRGRLRVLLLAERHARWTSSVFSRTSPHCSASASCGRSPAYARTEISVASRGVRRRAHRLDRRRRQRLDLLAPRPRDLRTSRRGCATIRATLDGSLQDARRAGRAPAARPPARAGRDPIRLPAGDDAPATARSASARRGTARRGGRRGSRSAAPSSARASPRSVVAHVSATYLLSVSRPREPDQLAEPAPPGTSSSKRRRRACGRSSATGYDQPRDSGRTHFGPCDARSQEVIATAAPNSPLREGRSPSRGDGLSLVRGPPHAAHGRDRRRVRPGGDGACSTRSSCPTSRA